VDCAKIDNSATFYVTVSVIILLYYFEMKPLFCADIRNISHKSEFCIFYRFLVQAGTEQTDRLTVLRNA